MQLIKDIREIWMFPQYKEDYLKSQNIYSKHIKETQRESWFQYCENTSNAYGNLFKFVTNKKLMYNDLIFTTLGFNRI